MTVTYHYAVTWASPSGTFVRDGLVWLGEPVDTRERYDELRAMIVERYKLESHVFSITSLTEMNREGK